MKFSVLFVLCASQGLSGFFPLVGHFVVKKIQQNAREMNGRTSFAEQVKTAERVQLDQIPLPDAPVLTPTSKCATCRLAAFCFTDSVL